MKRIRMALVSALIALCLVPGLAFAAPSASQPGSTAVSVSKPAVQTSHANDRTAEAGYHLEDKAVFRISTALMSKDKLVLDVSGGSTKVGANVQMYSANNTLAQYWRAEYMGNGMYRFVSLKGGNLLGAAGTVGVKTNVNMQKSANVNWRVAKNSDGTFSLIPDKNTKLRLDVSGAGKRKGTNVWLYSANNTKAQKFYFVKQAGLTEAFATGKTLNPGTYELVFAANKDMRVDISGASTKSGANAQVWQANNTQAQKFKVSYVGDGLYEIRNAKSNKALDVSGASTKSGANVQQYTPNSTTAQYWYLKKKDAGYQILSACSGLALDARNSKVIAKANVQVNSASNAASQVFTFTGKKETPAPVLGTRVVRNGTYVISSALTLAMVLDIAGGSTADKANVQIYRSNGTPAQQFKITHVGKNEHTIMNIKSGKYLEVAGASTTKGANVWQNAGSNAAAQRWYIEQGPTGLMFRSVATGQYLDVKAGSAKFGTNVQQYTGNKTKAQNWNLQAADWKFYPNGTSLNDLKVLLKAEEYEGMPYKWGGRSPATSFDCAGLVMYCSNAVWGTNFDLMYTNADRLLNETSYNHGRVKRISKEEAKPGDLVFYRGTYGSDINYISHVVFYAGRDTIYGAGDPIGYEGVDDIKNKNGKKAVQVFARITH